MKLLALLFLLASPISTHAQGLAREVTFPSDGNAVPGALVLPSGSAPVAGWPIVILVQGSGPSDRDETLGPNKIFKDLAEGLANRGVATLRYDKRTWLMGHGKLKFSPAEAAHISLAVEVVDDAVAALAFAAAQPGIDPKRVFVLGHSLGGTLAPRIAAERLHQTPGSVRGLITLSAGVLPASVIVPTQVAFQTGLQGASRAQQVQAATAMASGFDTALKPETDAAASSALGVPSGYLREWNAVDTAADLKAVALPALVLHGQKDVQITYLDYALLSHAATAPGSRSVEFAGLNHLFLPVEGESTGAEYYAVPAHVPAVVLDTISAWLPK